MTWWEYVERTADADNQETVARKLGLSQSSVGRWKTGPPKPANAAQFARVYGRPVLEAFVAAEFLTAEEARQAPSAVPDIKTVDDDDIIREVSRRMREGGTRVENDTRRGRTGEEPTNLSAGSDTVKPSQRDPIAGRGRQGLGGSDDTGDEQSSRD